MDSLELLIVYEKVAALTENMLNAARANDWELLAQLESDCSLQVRTLKEFETPVALTSPLRERKICLIKKILADDKAIRDLTEPWMQQLSKLMQSSNTTRMLSNSYGANQIG